MTTIILVGVERGEERWCWVDDDVHLRQFFDPNITLSYNGQVHIKEKAKTPVLCLANWEIASP